MRSIVFSLLFRSFSKLLNLLCFSTKTNSNNVDVVVFSVFEHGYKQCSDDPMGTYITPVNIFLNGYLQSYAQEEYDQGYDDYVTPDSAMYLDCVQQQVSGKNYWFQIGCTDGTSQSLSVNIYSDNTCTTRSVVDGMDDSAIDVSDIQVCTAERKDKQYGPPSHPCRSIFLDHCNSLATNFFLCYSLRCKKIPFKQCKECVNWVDMNDDQIDDMFYENRQIQAPMCSTAWQNKESCNKKCQRTGLEARVKEGWNTSDKILLAILALFGLVMLITILRKRQKMSNKDALLEQAAMSAAGLQQIHVIGIFVLVIMVVAVFALLGLKNITWALLLIINTVLFGYLMKLTVDSGISTGETVIGPDGTIIRRGDSDDSSVEETTDNRGNAGTYVLPQIT